MSADFIGKREKIINFPHSAKPLPDLKGGKCKISFQTTFQLKYLAAWCITRTTQTFVAVTF
ncbi:MAG: hypothetical protein U0989_16725 [Azonexus sp.]|nr:hypothetical protein [Azonexus sp.]MDZ4316398.1 hypothetical protein [Azonexus sp.]